MSAHRGRPRKPPKTYREQYVEPPRGPRAPRRTNRSAKSRALVGDATRDNDFTLAPLVRDTTAHLWAAWDYADAIEEMYREETPEFLFHRARRLEREEEQKMTRRERWSPPPPHRLNVVEGRRYRMLVMLIVRTNHPDLHADALGVVSLYLGDHVPGENG